jgi:hypothetical protein
MWNLQQSFLIIQAIIWPSPSTSSALSTYYDISAGLSFIEPHKASVFLFDYFWICLMLRSILVMVSNSLQCLRGDVMALDDVFGIVSPKAATIDTTMGVVLFQSSHSVCLLPFFYSKKALSWTYHRFSESWSPECWGCHHHKAVMNAAISILEYSLWQYHL